MSAGLADIGRLEEPVESGGVEDDLLFKVAELRSRSSTMEALDCLERRASLGSTALSSR
ncbi:hypothetical protein SF83666_c22900 [Sinorhizobium fredii CCBAU 83666]|nr:hypothetical protein SF83666_c22900 [Sinorhizobium fredii CCBAU 83666]